MKKNLYFTCAALLMASCSMKTYYQVVDVKSTNLQKESNNYVYNDGVCKIVYNFWGNGGNAGFTIENLSDEIIYVDMEKSFYIENGIANDYYRARIYGAGKDVKLVVAASIASGYSSDIAYMEKPIVAIPPHALKSFSEYEIIEDAIQDCAVKMMVKKNQPDGIVYTESESPIKFKNYITYKNGENGATKEVSNDFYIGGFTNYISSDIIKTRKRGCKQTVTKTYNEKYASDRFYWKYNNTTSNDNSADAKASSTKSSSNDMYKYKKNNQ
ncbi:MAG: hypothetical protein IJ148_09315 [Bacteroidaceae bacterium]|nr:hypothetical protein [Bacteroidaceae bacterium]